MRSRYASVSCFFSVESVGDGTLRYLDSVKTHLSESETTRTKEHPVEVQAVENREKVKNKK